MTTDEAISSRRLWTVDEVAAVLRVSERTLRRLAADGLVHPVMIRGQVRYQPAEVARLLARGTAA